MKTIIDQTTPSIEVATDSSRVGSSGPAAFTPQSLTAASSAGPAAPDPFDPSQFAANSCILGGIGVTKELIACPVRKPNRQEFIRVHPAPEYQLRAHVLELKAERETYLVVPAIAAELPGETKIVTLRLCASRQGAIFIWPVAVPSIDGRDNGWGSSARAAAAKAESHWVRMIANMDQGCYDVFSAPGALGTPVWPDKELSEILAISFGDSFIIRDPGHPVIKRLTGLA